MSAATFARNHFACHPDGCGAMPGEPCDGSQDPQPDVTPGGLHDARWDAYRRWLDVDRDHPGYMDPAAFQAQERRGALPEQDVPEGYLARRAA